MVAGLPFKKLEPEFIIAIIEEYNKGTPYSQISKLFDITIGKVAGIVYRARYNAGTVGHDLIKNKPDAAEIRHALEKQSEEDERRREKNRIVKEERPVVVKKVGVRLPPVLPTEEDMKKVRLRLVTSDTAVTCEELEKHHCRWPIGDPRYSDFRFCGKPRLEGQPYCKECCAVAFVPRQFRKVG